MMTKNIQKILIALLLLVAGGTEAWGQVTYQYYAIHNKDKGYLKQVNGNVAIDNTFRYENSHDGNGSSIWVLSSDGYLQQEMYYLNVANDQTLYLSTEKVTRWITATEGDKTYLKPSGSTKFLCADSGPQLKAETSYKLNACAMTIAENGTTWEGPKDVSFTVQSPQLVTYLRTYYVRSIIATISKDDAGTISSKVVDKKNSRCYCSLTYSTTTDANKGTKWDINETSGVIYSKQTSGDYSVAATYSVAPLDPIALSLHPAADKTVTLNLKPSPLAPDAGKNYLLFYTKDANYRFPYDDGSLSENDAVKTNATRSVLTEPSNNPNNNISWKIVRDNEGFYSFRNVNSGRWLRFDGGQFVNGSDYGVIEVGAVGDATPAGNEYKFRLYKSGTYKNTNTAPTYCILPYSKQYAVYKSDGVATNAPVALSVYTTPKVISLNKANDDSKYCIFAYEAENRVYGNFTLSGPSSALATGNYTFNTTQSYSSRNIIGSPSNVQDLEINGSYSVADLTFNWQVNGLDGYITKQTPTVSSGKGTQVVTVNSLPSGTLYGKVRVRAKGGTIYSGWKELEFNLYGEPSYTDISSLSEITSSNGYYRLTADASDTPGVTEFSGFLDGNMHKISGVSAPLFTTLTGTVKNLVLENVSISSGDASGNTGAIACTANGAARIYNVGILSGSVSGTGYAGGLVGFLDGSARVINCFSYANVSGGTVGGIVGYNNVATTATNLKTMVMNCMFYGEVSGSSIAPIYNGNIITNVGKNAGVSNFNYFRLESSYIQNTDITKVYNCALGAETRFLQRFEFFRNTLNSHRELAAWWATGSMDNKDKMMKWVLEPSQIGSSTPFPILKTPDYYPSVINIDAENASTATERNKGGKLGTLSVTIQSGSGKVFSAPEGASITKSSLTLNITDKDFDHFNFNYYKVQLPYYNDVGTGNYTGNRVVTGWKIVSITGGTPGTFSTSTADAPSFNFADRNCTNKDLYSVSGRVFNQGAYWDVPEGVTGITIQPYWAKAAYVADAYPDVVYNANMTEAYDVSNVGGGQKYTNNTNYNIAGEQQRVFTSISEAVTNANGLNKPTGNSVHDYAVVLVGNVHQYTENNGAIGSNYKYTVTTIDLDHDNEPDYSLMLRNDGRNKLHPAKWDFLNIVGLGMAQKSTGGTGSYNQGIFQPLYWFETTNTSLFRVTQFEYDNSSRVEAPLILQGGVMEQWVSGQSGGRSNNTTYFHVGGNVWFKEFHRGTHQDQSYDSKHPPVSVTGGDYNEFYLTGLYTANVASYADNAECYINGGRFGIVAGAAMEGIGKANGADNTGNITWQVQNADIREFYAGGINAAKPVTGNLNTTITGGKIDLFCGGPKFGDMSTGKTVTTNATNCIFGTFFGAGYGGNSYSRQAPRNHNNMTNFPHNDSQAGNDDSWNAWLGRFYTQSYSSTYGGVSTQFSYQFLPMSANADNCGRIFVEYVKFSLATCRNATSTLTGCKITGNFYGGGSLGKVDGPVASTLTNCEVQGNVFGAGFSASLPSVEVDATGFATEPYYYKDLGTYREGVKDSTTTYTWQKKTGNSWVDNTNHILYTPEDLDGLGVVTGNVNLTLDNSTVGSQADDTLNKGNVFGGGEQSSVDGNTTVTITGGNIYGSVFGGGDLGSVGTFETNGDGKPIRCAANTGKCTVEIKGAANIGHDGMKMPDDWGHVFGAGRGTVNPEEAAKVGGHIDHVAYVDTTHVYIGVTDGTIDASPLIKGSVYGGSENGHVLHGTYVEINSGQIGVGKNTTARYTAEQWSGGSSLAPCASWTYEEDGYVYDPYTPEGGWDDLHKYLRPSSKTATDGHTYYGNVFGGGSGVIPYAAGEWQRASGLVEGSTKVVINGGHILTSVYGGNEQTDVLGETSVVMNGGTVGVPRDSTTIMANPALCYVFGGGKGDKRTAFNTWTNVKSTSVAIKGGTVYGSVYGGGEDGHVLRDAAMAVTPAENKTVRIGCGGTSGYDGNVFGGGQGSPVAQTAGVISGNVSVNVTGGTMWGSVYGGGRLASVGTYLVPATETPSDKDKYGKLIPDGKEQVVTDDGSAADITVAKRTHGEITMTVTGGNIKGSVFGAGKGDRRTDFNTWTNVKSTSVTINGGTIEGSVFGGGEDGHVLRDAVTSIAPAAGKTIVIGADDGKDNGNVFGGGQGSTTALTAGVVSGNVTLDIKGGTMWGSVYGGGRLAAVGTYLVPAPETPSETDKYGRLIPDGKEQIVVNNGPGYEEDAEGRTHGNITVSLTGGTIHGDVFGGGMGTLDDEHGTAAILGISKNVQLDLNDGVEITGVKGCVVKGNIFGCNNMNASPKGTVDVHIYATQNEAASQIANTAEVEDAKVDGRYDVKAVYGGGNMAAYVPEDLSNGKTNVTIDGCQLTSIQQVYGGGNAASTPATSVTVNGTYEIEEVFGGGNGKDDIIVDGVTKPNPGANVGFYDYSAVEDVYDTKEKRETEEFVSEYVYGTGAASVNIFGGTIHRVFGGSNTKGNVKNTAVTMLDENSDCAFCVDEAYGGGKSAPMDAEAKLLMACIPGLKSVYGGAEAADVHGDVTLNITNGTFKRVFGGNNISGTIDGAIKVNIEEVGCRPIIIGELYGGGNKAAYSIYGYNDDGTIKESGTRLYADPQVNLKAFTSIGAVYGGGYGTTATMVGSPTVNINEVVGDPHKIVEEVKVDTYPTSGTDASTGGTYTATGYSGATHVEVDTDHYVDLPAHVKGKIGAVGKVFGGGNAAKVMGSTTVNVGNLSTVDFESTGEGEAEPRTGVTVIGADIKGNVYGGGDEAEVTGNANVNVGKRKVATP